MTWISANLYSGTPSNAVFAGNDSDGAVIYVGRAYHEGDLIPGKVVPSKNAAYISYNGIEIAKHSFQYLCNPGTLQWVSSFNGNIAPYAVVGGHTASGEPLYVGRGHFNRSLTPGKIHQSHGCLYLPYGGFEHRLTSYEVLVRSDPSWGPNHYPNPAPPAPGFAIHKKMQNCHTWINYQPGSSIPVDAVFAGQDTNGSPIYVGRSYHKGDFLPAKVLPHHNISYISYNGMEIPKHEFELLTGQNYSWVNAANGHVPADSVEGGRTRNGEPLYIGRANWNGSLIPGKIHPSHGCLYLPHNGREEGMKNDEALRLTQYSLPRNNACLIEKKKKS